MFFLAKDKKNNYQYVVQNYYSVVVSLMENNTIKTNGIR